MVVHHLPAGALACPTANDSEIGPHVGSNEPYARTHDLRGPAEPYSRARAVAPLHSETPPTNAHETAYAHAGGL